MTNPLLHNALLRGESSPHNVHHRGAITARVRNGQAEQNREEKNLENDMIKFLGARKAKILWTIIFLSKIHTFMLDESWQLSGGFRVCVQCTTWIIRRAYQPGAVSEYIRLISAQERIKEADQNNFLETNLNDLVGEPGWPDGESFVKFKEELTPLLSLMSQSPIGQSLAI